MSVKGNKNAYKKFDWSLIDDLLKINCTGEEIAAVINVDYDTIQNHCKKENGVPFSEYIKKGNDNFKVSLKRLQFRAAKDGNVTMLIWLGKQYLSQSDKQEIKHDNKVKVVYEPMTID